MINNKLRVGRFTSSEIYNLIKVGSRKMDAKELLAYKAANPKGRKENIDAGFQAGGLTYIEKKRIERRLERSVDQGAYSRPMAWGKFLELVVFANLDMSYQILSKETTAHPTLGNIWSGSVDLLGDDFVSEIKCYQLYKFAKYTDCILKGEIKCLREEFPEEYWQIVSNAVIHDKKFGEVITYCPYESELEEIRLLAENYDGHDQWMYKFIVDCDNSELACLKDGGYYKNINRFRFEIPQEDKDFLTARVIEAGEILTAA